MAFTRTTAETYSISEIEHWQAGKERKAPSILSARFAREREREREGGSNTIRETSVRSGTRADPIGHTVRFEVRVPRRLFAVPPFVASAAHYFAKKKRREREREKKQQRAN